VRRSFSLLALAAAAAGCNSFDKLLEADIPPDARLSLSLPAAPLSVPQGGVHSFVVSVTCVGDCAGPPGLMIDDAPAGVTLEKVASPSSGLTTTATVTVQVGASVPVGNYALKVRGQAPKITEVQRIVNLAVTAPPGYSLTLSRPALTIARGGIARLSARLDRTNFPAPVTLALAGASGISATFGGNPVSDTVSDVTILVAADVAPGTYTMSVGASATGMAERTAQLAVTVIADALQLIPDSAITTPQGSTATAALILNRAGHASAVTLEAEGLPAGTTASFQTDASSTATVAFSVGASTPDSYPVTLRAKSNGVPDATATIVLTITPAGIAITLSPASLQIAAGASASVALAISRTSFSGPVAITAEGVPAGVAITPSPANPTGSASTLVITTTAGAVAGDYPVSIRATPAGLEPNAQTLVLALTIRPPVSAGQVVLSWAGCVAPVWVAVQDGSGPWNQVTPNGGVVQFSVASATGGFAYAENGASVGISVQHMTRAELVAQPIHMCPAVPGTRTVSGVAQHSTPSETGVYRLGGGTATSTPTASAFTITSVNDGTHDLIGWGVSGLGVRALIRRDVSVTDNSTLGPVSFIGSESFPAFNRNMSVSGTLAGENLTYSMHYLTTPACTANLLYIGGATFGMPESVQRPSDFHLFTATATSPSRQRNATSVFHTMAARTVALPPAIATPAISTLAGPYKRLSASLGNLPTGYNKSVELRYLDSRKFMRVTATVGYSGVSGVTLSMPDFSGVSGWPADLAVQATATGSWEVAVDGATFPGSMCVENNRTIFTRVNGAF
jgi:hypothetical protein